MKPFFRDDQCHATPRRRRLSDAAEAAWPDRTVPPGHLFAEGGCESGNFSGTEADLERCVAVSLDLRDNNLRLTTGGRDAEALAATAATNTSVLDVSMLCNVTHLTTIDLSSSIDCDDRGERGRAV